MKSVLGMRWTVFAGLILMTACAIAIIEYLHSNQKNLQKEQLQMIAQEDLAVLRSELKSAIYSDIFFVNSLATLVTVNPQSTTEQWEGIAEELFRKSRFLRNIAMAPGDVIRFVYPRQGNEKALGLDFRTVPEQWKTVQKSKEMQAIFLAGPLNLVQGGMGLIARTPIFTDPPLNYQYWGNCSVVIDIDRLFSEVGIDQILDKYQFAMRGKDGAGIKGEVFLGDEAIFEDVFVSEEVRFPSGSWVMAISPGTLYESLPWVRRNASRLLGYPMLLLLQAAFISIYYLYHKAHQRSLEDELTRLPNRRYLMYTLEQQVENVSKKGQSFALLNLDLNDFKVINDTYGHSAGDTVLIEVAKRIKDALRVSDIIARVGGDEFLVILPRVKEKDDINNIIAHLIQKLTGTPVSIAGDDIHIRVSIGHAIYGREGMDIDTLMSAADRSMYRQKGKKNYT